MPAKACHNAINILLCFSKAVPIHQTHVTFSVHKKNIIQATTTQFPLTLAWAVTINKCQGLTLSEIVIDMTHVKHKFKP